MLGGMALKWRWRDRVKAAGKPAEKPNLVMGANVQVCWEKFCRYWEVEPRVVPMEGDRFHLSAEEAVKRCDENTIGVVAILGSTFDGSYEPVGGDRGGARPPPGRFGPRRADPRRRRVGRVRRPVPAPGPGVGLPASLGCSRSTPRATSTGSSTRAWAGRSGATRRRCPKDLVFDVNYLGGHMPTFALNFSRPGSEVIAQYFMFLLLGHAGFTRVQRNSSDIAQYLSSGIAEIGPYELLTKGDELPVFAFRLKDGIDNYTVFDVSARLREGGWLVPAYTFPENRQDLSVLRIVVRAGMTLDMADLFLEELRRRTTELQGLTEPLPDALAAKHGGFAH